MQAAVNDEQKAEEHGGTSAPVRAVYQRLRRAAERDRFPSIERRIAILDALEQELRSEREAITRAVSADFGHRSSHDTELGDLWMSLSQLRHVRAHLRQWVRPEVRAPLWVFRPATARIVAQPLGVVGIIAPWNYPVMLAVAPLVGAIAAGNRVVLKLSEHVPQTSQLLATILSRVAPEDWVGVLQGGASVGEAVSELPLDHLLFTGSTEVGRRIAVAAAKNLVPVTLELGGKSPALLHESFPVDKFAARIVQGKCYSAGQSCVAPDYLLVPSEREQEVVSALERAVARCFPTMRDNPDYTAVVSPERAERLRGLVADARQRGARVIEINPAREHFTGTQKLPLHLLLDVPDDAQVLREEIFGPVLPIVTYRQLDEAIRYVNAHPRPLALYYFDRDRRRIDQVMEQTVSGGATVNDTLLHFLCDALPRAAVGDSGQGAYLGRASFERFSHRKSVLYQSRMSAVGSFAPPYGPLVEWVLRRVLRV